MNRTYPLLVAGLMCQAALLAQPSLADYQQNYAQQVQSLAGGRGGRGVNIGPLPRTETGKPFSATVTTQTNQTFLDGTHVNQTTTSVEYRDAEGRVRSETSEPGTAVSGQTKVITIRDPVAGVIYRLDAARKTAVKLTLDTSAMTPGERQQSLRAGTPAQPLNKVIERIEFRGMSRGSQDTLRAALASKVGDPFDSEVQRRDLTAIWSTGRFSDVQVMNDVGLRGGVIVTYVVTERDGQTLPSVVLPVAPGGRGRGGRGGGALQAPAQIPQDAQAKLQALAQGLQAARNNDIVEDLGTMVVNGITARGTRLTTVVPVGAIGNDREFRSVSERWFSADLNLLIKSAATDPRFGTTTYELTNISRQPPDPSLFQVPADYDIASNVR